MNINTEEDPIAHIETKTDVMNETEGSMLNTESIPREKILAIMARVLPYMKTKKEDTSAPAATESQILFLITEESLVISAPTATRLNSRKLKPADCL
jgi:hypothetical protein